MGAGRETQKGRDICILIAEAHCCTTMFVSVQQKQNYKAIVLQLEINLKKNLYRQEMMDVQ